MKVDLDGEVFSLYADVETKDKAKIYVSHELNKKQVLSLAADLLDAVLQYESREEEEEE